MKNYTLKSTGMPKELERQVYYFIRGYPRLKAEYDNIIGESPPPPDGLPKGTGAGDPTSRDGIRRAELRKELEAIEQSILAIPEEYRKGVWDNIMYHTPYPGDADRATYWRHKTRFMRRVAEKMCWI